MSVISITSENYESQVLNADKPVVLDFWAPWCGPCRTIAPIVEEIAETRPDVIVGKINVDTEMELAVKFGVVSIPTVVVLRRGEVCARAVGYSPKGELLGHLGL